MKFAAGKGILVALTALATLATAVLTGCRPFTAGGATASERWQRLAGQSTSRSLDVVLITVDTLRADRLGVYGAQSPATPHIDRLAAEGVRFTNAASTVPFTLPAHSSIMTGTYPPFHGVRENVGYRLGDGLPTLAERLAAGGWATGGFVSAFVLDSRWGIGRGFATYFDDFETSEERPTNLGGVQRDGAETIAAAVDWLDRERRRPFFLWLHLFDPHDPYTPPEPFRSRHPRRPYDGEVAYADHLVGRFRAALEERGLLATTLLVFTADHGEGLGQHRERFHGFFVYDSTVHVPLIVRPPFPDLAGTVIDEAVSHVDLLPTVLEAVAQPVPETVQGRSLLPLMLGMEGEGEGEGGERVVYSESMYPLLHYGWAPLRSVRSRSHKLIAAPRPELYDLAADPGETANRLFDDRPTSRRLLETLEALRRRIEARERNAPPADLDEETLRQLEALGYLAGGGGVSLAEEDAVERADPKDRVELHQLVMAAQSAIGGGDMEEAGRLLERAVAADATIVDGHQMLGSLALQADRLDEAVEHFQAALAVRADHALALWGLASAYRRLGRHDDALVGFQRLLANDPGDTKAVVAVAALLNRGGRRDEAIAVLERALERDDPAPILFNQLGELTSLAGDAAAAAGLFERALEARTDLVPALFNLAVLREEAGRADEAAALYERLLVAAPRHFRAQFNLGRLYGARGDVAGQRRLWTAAIESNPDFVRGYYYLAKLLMDSGGDLARAEELTREGLARDPDNQVGQLGHFLLADILNRLGRPDEAARALEAGRRLASG